MRKKDEFYNQEEREVLLEDKFSRKSYTIAMGGGSSVTGLDKISSKEAKLLLDDDQSLQEREKKTSEEAILVMPKDRGRRRSRMTQVGDKKTKFTEVMEQV